MKRLTNPLIVQKTGEVLAYKLNSGVTDTKARTKLGELEDLEEQGLLLRLPAPLDGVESFSLDGKKTWFGFPCNVGDDVYFIPSKVNFELNILNGYGENNRVYHQKIKRITLVGKTWYVECDKDIEYGTNRIHVARFFKKTWFLSQEEAEAALEKMKGEEHE